MKKRNNILYFLMNKVYKRGKELLSYRGLIIKEYNGLILLKKGRNLWVYDIFTGYGFEKVR